MVVLLDLSLSLDVQVSVAARNSLVMLKAAAPVLPIPGDV